MRAYNRTIGTVPSELEFPCSNFGKENDFMNIRSVSLFFGPGILLCDMCKGRIMDLEHARLPKRTL